MKKRQGSRLTALLLALTLLAGLTLPALAAETATVIRLTKTTGTVEISKSSGKSVPLLKNMRLYNGYHVVTGEESYAWINLDDSKLNKQDAGSEVEVRKDGKKLEVLLCSGNLFFDVAEPLEDDESMNIRTSTTAVGIRGTSGWMECVDRWTTRVSVLEGTVECSVKDPVTGQFKSEEIRGGETAACVVFPQDRAGDKCDIIKETYAVPEIPGYVLTDLVQNIDLCDKVRENTGVDILRELAKEAGGDPSGRAPDGKSASPEVLGIADRREREDEDTLHEKMEQVEKEQGKPEDRPDTVSPDKALSNPAPSSGDRDTGGSSDRDSDSDSSGGDSGGTAAPDPTPTPPQSHGMKLTDVEVQALLDAGSSVAIEPNADASDAAPKKNTLEVDTGLSVASGKTLDLQSGIDLEVCPGKTLQVDGTLTADALQNNGTTTVTSGNTLRLRGNLTTSGTLTVTSTGRVVVDGTFASSGTVTLASGAAVLAKAFAPDAAPSGWEVSAAVDESGYYTLVPAEVVVPPVYTVTFDAGGNSGAPAPMTTGTDGKLASVPEFIPSGCNAASFSGWYDAETGGTMISTDTIFTKNTVVYARWIGWNYDEGTSTLTILGKGPMETYATLASRPWHSAYKNAASLIISEGVTSITTDAFAHSGTATTSKLTSVTLPSSLTSIGRTAFMYCNSLTSIELPDSVSSIGNDAFEVCTKLENVRLPASLDSLPANIFNGCVALKGIDIPAAVTSIGTGAFRNCSALTSVTIPGSVTSIESSAFNGCSGLQNVTILEGVETIETSAFYGCSSLASVTIPPSVTLIEQNAFAGSGLTSVTVPGSITRINMYVFRDCSSLASVYISDGITYIGERAFAGCGNLRTVRIPTSITGVENAAFQGTNVDTINFGGTSASWNESLFYDTELLLNSPTIHYE